MITDYCTAVSVLSLMALAVTETLCSGGIKNKVKRFFEADSKDKDK